MPIDALLDALDFPPDAHPEADAIAARWGADDVVRSFLRRSLHGVYLDRGVNTFDPDLIEDWNDEDKRADEDVSRMLVFGDDGGGRVFLLDPRDRLGFGPHAVYVVGMGTLSIDDVERVATSLEDLLQRLIDGRELGEERLLGLRDAQTAGKALPLRLGDGTELPADAVADPRYHVGADVLRSVRLTRPLTLRAPLVPMPDRLFDHDPDVKFYRDGRVESAYVAGGVIDGQPLAPGSWARWSRDGRLTTFVPAAVVRVNGVPVKAGVSVHHDAPTFFFTPAEDCDWKGFRCKAGEKVEDYGGGLGLHLTNAKGFSFKGQPVPAGVRLTVMSDGGLRFHLEAPLLLGARMLPAGTALWYDGQGKIREIYVPPEAQ
jgi:hypothetical protein